MRRRERISTQKLEQRQAGLLRFDIPARDVERAQGMHLEFLKTIDFPDFMPQLFGHQWIGADELLQTPARHVRQIMGPAAAGAANDALISLDFEDGTICLITLREGVIVRQSLAPVETGRSFG